MLRNILLLSVAFLLTSCLTKQNWKRKSSYDEKIISTLRHSNQSDLIVVGKKQSYLIEGNGEFIISLFEQYPHLVRVAFFDSYLRLSSEGLIAGVIVIKSNSQLNRNEVKKLKELGFQEAKFGKLEKTVTVKGQIVKVKDLSKAKEIPKTQQPSIKVYTDTTSFDYAEKIVGTPFTITMDAAGMTLLVIPAIIYELTEDEKEVSKSAEEK